MADTAFYNRMAATALRLIESKGRDDLVLSRAQPGAYDPVEGTSSPGSTLTQSIKCIVQPLDQASLQAWDEATEDGSLIESNVRMLLIAAQGLAWSPETGDTVNLDGDTWAVLGATSLSPAGIPLVYRAAIKKGT